jgi:hypothetical protein
MFAILTRHYSACCLNQAFEYQNLQTYLQWVLPNYKAGQICYKKSASLEGNQVAITCKLSTSIISNNAQILNLCSCEIFCEVFAGSRGVLYRRFEQVIHSYKSRAYEGESTHGKF